MQTAAQVKKALKQLSDPEKAQFFPTFFKTGKGQYGEGDKFLGVTVPHQRKVARQFRDLKQPHVVKLLDDRFHECRLTALLIMTLQFERAEESRREEIVELFERLPEPRRQMYLKGEV